MTTRLERIARRVAKTLPEGRQVCPECSGAGETWTATRGPIVEPLTCWRCKGDGSVRA